MPTALAPVTKVISPEMLGDPSVRAGSEATSAIFKSEGVDLDEYYEPVMKATQDHEGYTHGETVTGKNSDNLASDNGEGMTESCEESASTSNDDYQRGFETGKKHMDFLEKNVSGNGSAKKENYLDDISGALSKYKGKSVQNSTESLEACAKSATPEGVGIHIPTVNEMMAFKKSGTSMYTAISREAAEPHGIVKMDNEPEIPSVKDMFAKRFGHC